MEVRKTEPSDDFAAIGNIYVKSWQAAYRGIVPQNYLDTLSGGWWAQRLAEGRYDDYVIMENGVYVGTSSTCAARDEDMAGYGEIISIYMLPEYFGKGFAAPLIKYVENALKEKGYENIYLWALEDNARARRFYEKQGFHTNGDTTTMEISGKVLAEVRYVKRLT